MNYTQYIDKFNENDNEWFPTLIKNCDAKAFLLENLTYRKKSYNIYYDEDGTVFGKGKGISVEEI